MSPFAITIMTFSLGMGTMLTFASSHSILAWMGLEMTTLAIIPMMAQPKQARPTEAAVKYFLIQAAGAATFLFAAMTNAWLTGLWDIQHMTHPLPVALLIIALSLKIGLAPLHTWMPEVLQGLELTTGLLMATWQKLAPFALLLQIYPQHSHLLASLGLLSTLVGGWGALNQNQLRKVLAYSSIAHLGWILLVLQFSNALALLTLFMYLIMTFSTFLAFKLVYATHVNALASSWTKVPALTALLPLVLLSLGGLPPLSGFMPKWLILQELTKQDLAPIATLAALTALLSLYFYLRLAYAISLTMYPNYPAASAPWRHLSEQLTMPLTVSAIATVMLLPLAPTILTTLI
uniref:NADH dehydrogenase subunit 2 n=1 Tax=Macrodon ancylodon TaxID=227978 RepID=UPI0030FEF945